MPTCDLLLCTLFTLTTVVSGTSDCAISLIASISFNHFTRKKHWFDKVSVDLDVHPFACWKWTMSRDYFSGLNTSANAISKSGRIKLVAIVSWIEWVGGPFVFLWPDWIWFVKALEVNAIMIDLACSSFITLQSIFESNL